MTVTAVVQRFCVPDTCLRMTSSLPVLLLIFAFDQLCFYSHDCSLRRVCVCALCALKLRVSSSRGVIALLLHPLETSKEICDDEPAAYNLVGLRVRHFALQEPGEAGLL